VVRNVRTCCVDSYLSLVHVPTVFCACMAAVSFAWDTPVSGKTLPLQVLELGAAASDRDAERARRRLWRDTHTDKPGGCRKAFQLVTDAAEALATERARRRYADDIAASEHAAAAEAERRRVAAGAERRRTAAATPPAPPAPDSPRAHLAERYRRVREQKVWEARAAEYRVPLEAHGTFAPLRRNVPAGAKPEVAQVLSRRDYFEARLLQHPALSMLRVPELLFATFDVYKCSADGSTSECRTAHRALS
jgi:hypothetical protein